MSSIFEGGLLSFDAACEVESRYFAACAMSQVSKNTIHTPWFQLNALKKGASLPAAPAPSKVKRLGVLGAGMMAAGIAYTSAKARMDVVLLDTKPQAAATGKAHAEGCSTRQCNAAAARRGSAMPCWRASRAPRSAPTRRVATSSLKRCSKAVA